MQDPDLVVDYQARDQFVGFHDRLERFACIVTHRRAGKTVACIHDLQRAAIMSQRIRPRLASVRESALRVDYAGGGQVRLYRADNPDALRGIYLDGVVLDEYADMDPRVWSEIIRRPWPIAPAGRCSSARPRAARILRAVAARAIGNKWFSLILKASDTGLIAASELALAKRDLSEEQYAQEFECSFEAAVVGAYFGKLMAGADAERRIAAVPYDPAAPVWTSWDLGVRDATAIWFAQVIGREIRIIDYYEASGVDLGHYVRELNARPYIYAGHVVPHDAQARELGTGKSRLEVLASLGLKNLQIAPMHRLEDGINAVRVFLPKCWFDAEKCARGIDALKLYRAEVDERRADPAGTPLLKPQPVHDWTSHAADSFRYLALTLDRQATQTGFYRRIDYASEGVV